MIRQTTIVHDNPIRCTTTQNCAAIALILIMTSLTKTVAGNLVLWLNSKNFHVVFYLAAMKQMNENNMLCYLTE